MPTGWAIVIVVQWLAIAGLIIVVLGILRQMASLIDRAATGPVMRILPPAAEVGTRLPAFASTADGGATEPAALLAGRPAVLLFLSAGCAPCLSLAAEIAGSDLPGELGSALIVITAPGSESVARLPAGVRVMAVPDAECDRVLGIPGRPFAMAVNADGVITARQPVNTLAQLAGIATSAWSLDDVPSP
jgi:hypothetical protein